MSKTVMIITGASKGLGKQFLLELLNEPCDEIWAIARKSSALDELKSLDSRIRPMNADLSKMEDVLSINDLLEKENVSVTWLINNAGYGKFGAFMDMPLDVSMNMIDLDIKAVVALCRIVIPYMKAGSHIINVASLASTLPIPYMDIYASCKVFVRNFTRALNQELKDENIHAMALCPGWMNTDFLKRGKTDSSKTVTRFDGLSSAAPVAKAAIKSAKAGKDVLYPKASVKTVHVLTKLFPAKLSMKAWLASQHIQ